jgi:hypothetical protein
VTSKIAALLNQKNGKERKTTSKPLNWGIFIIYLKNGKIFEIGEKDGLTLPYL